MANKTQAPAPPVEEGHRAKFSFKTLFSTKRQIFWFVFFVLWCAIDVALLGLVSQQIHNHGSQMNDWPTGQYQHAMGLLLFATIFSLIVGIFHFKLNLPALLFLFLVSHSSAPKGLKERLTIRPTPRSLVLAPVSSTPLPLATDYSATTRSTSSPPTGDQTLGTVNESLLSVD